jgi:hypothetical protein
VDRVFHLCQHSNLNILETQVYLNKPVEETMSKLTISFESTSAPANPFLSEDGLLNFVKIAALQEKVANEIKASQKSEAPIKPSLIYVMARRAKPVSFRKAAHTKGTDLKYKAGRAIKIASRKRLVPEALARVSIVLQVIDSSKLNAALKQAVSAITQHVKRTAKALDKISTEKSKIRDASNKVFDTSVSMLKDILSQGGVKPTDVVESMGMMGKSVIIRLGADNYVSVNKADRARFLAAKKTAAQS